MKILVIDNYDSFTYNLVYLIKEIRPTDITTVWRNDTFKIEDVKDFDKILLSPGPGIPKESGLLLKTIIEYAPTKSILGVCLGLQAIGECFGGTLHNLDAVYHGIQTDINILPNTNPKYLQLYNNIPPNFKAGRYHSWVVQKNNFPAENLTITCEDNDGYIMGMHHNVYDVQGVQFHPESILTPHGNIMLKNWLQH